MHMNSATHLLPEDRPEFERVLEEALRRANPHRDSAVTDGRLTTEQLRTMALAASATICAHAAAEYRHYVELRDELRAPSAVPDPSPQDGHSENGGPGTAPDTVGATESSGAGLMAVFSVLAGTAAVIFLLIGYLLHYVDSHEPAAKSLINTGWAFVALAAVGIVIAMAGLLLTALRHSGASLPSSEEWRAEEVDRAREAWRQALLEHGLLPFLREALADPAPERYAAEGTYGGVPGPVGRTPQLGYSRPGFSTESGPEDGARPSFESPGYTSPDYGGPEHEPT
jgi:hypothetical protein